MKKQSDRRILGIDFSGGREAGRKIWVAAGRDANGILEIDSLLPGHALPDSSFEREKALPALVSFLKAQTGAIAGFDFPFALHRDQMPASWGLFLGEMAQHETAEEFRSQYAALVDGVERRRATDIETRTPLAPTNLRIYRQTYYGVRDLLGPLVKFGARVLPMQEPREGALHLIEACPASLLKREKLYISYKGRSASQHDARNSIFDAIHERYGLTASEDIRNRAIDDAEGDALDSIITALCAWRALQSPDCSIPRPDSNDIIEGRVYC